MKAVVAAFNQEKALVGAFSVITNLRMELVLLLPCQGVTTPRRATGTSRAAPSAAPPATTSAAGCRWTSVASARSVLVHLYFAFSSRCIIKVYLFGSCIILSLIPQKATINKPEQRTVNRAAEAGSQYDIYKHNPWRAPGSAPVVGTRKKYLVV